ncbi:hypothetical protein EON67_00680 [archaeon]|nr:MAG: hypothetical protein EON67_00680 [archaeon]
MCAARADESKWGMCNRFCPWCTLCADKHLRQEEVKVELTEERSLTGKSSKLNSAYGKSMADKAPGTTSMVNPMLARRTFEPAGRDEV